MSASDFSVPCNCSAQPLLGWGTTGRDEADLSDRELEVVYAWISQGSKRDVAASLFISYRTVATHIERVRVKYADLGRDTGDKTTLLLRLLEDGYVRFDRRKGALFPRRTVRAIVTPETGKAS